MILEKNPVPFTSPFLDAKQMHNRSIPQQKESTDALQFQQTLSKFLPTPIDVKLNANRSHFISVRFNRSMKPISASIHNFFLQAPQDIIETLALYIRNKGKGQLLINRLRDYISDMFRIHGIENSGKRPVYKESEGIGKRHNLHTIVKELNSQLFTDPVNPSIIWFTAPKRDHPIVRCSLGLYFDELNLIKINSKLDNAAIPDFVVSTVVYHEMLHMIYAPKCFPSGRRIIHTKEFKDAERKHPRFLDAEDWLNQNRNSFFHTLSLL